MCVTARPTQGSFPAPAPAVHHPQWVTTRPRVHATVWSVDACYEFRIRGRLNRPLLSEFQDLNLTPASERVETVLAGPVEDLAALHGILRRFEALGIELLDVHKVAGHEEARGG